MPLTSDDVIAMYDALGVTLGGKIAVGVSGGADSLSLLLLTASNYDVTAITVDHGLRADSATEALFVNKVCSEKGIKHVTLRWEGVKPTSNIQAEARAARYSLMQRWCSENDIPFLAVAHHRDDQAETLLLRLARGSGVYGLAAMPSQRDIGGGVSIVRPLLSIPKSQLIEVLKSEGQEWIEDPSNRSEAYDRVRVRNLLAAPPLEGFSSERLAATAYRLRRSRDALEYYEQLWLKSAVTIFDSGYLTVDVDKLASEPEEIILRGLASVCRYFNNAEYVPRMEKLQRLKDMLLSTEFRGHTLYGAKFSAPKSEKIMVSRELSAVEGPISLEKSVIWDNRFAIRTKGDISGMKIAALGAEGWLQLKAEMPNFDQIDVPRIAGLVLPAIFHDGELQAVPHIGYKRLVNIEIELSVQTDILTKK